MLEGYSIIENKSTKTNMGIYLSSPDTRKHSVDGQGNGVAFGASSMQGWRLNHEDSQIFEPDLENGIGVFGVFDGHAGVEASKYCEEYFV